jgi:hypothetical protein
MNSVLSVKLGSTTETVDIVVDVLFEHELPLSAATDYIAQIFEVGGTVSLHAFDPKRVDFSVETKALADLLRPFL